jgi:hypothetical protein
MSRLNVLIAMLVALSLLASACGSAGSGAPSSPGQYPVQNGSVHFDGDRYQLYWGDPSGSLHRLDTHNLRLVQDPNSTFLEVPQSGDPILHMRQDEPITVDGRDQQGAFSSPWFPFILGATLGNVFGGGRGGGQTIVINNPAPGESRSYDPGTPAYRYPPTGSFGRDDELHGSLDSSKPQLPDYSKVQPAPYAASGKAAGTGGGAAASNKSGGGSSGGTSANATSAQSGGSGGGSAASGKGGFSSGTQSYSGGTTNLGGAGSRGVLPGSSSGGVSSKPSTSLGGGGSGSKGISGARAPSGGRR